MSQEGTRSVLAARRQVNRQINEAAEKLEQMKGFVAECKEDIEKFDLEIKKLESKQLFDHQHRIDELRMQREFRQNWILQEEASIEGVNLKLRDLEKQKDCWLDPKLEAIARSGDPLANQVLRDEHRGRPDAAIGEDRRPNFTGVKMVG